MWGKYYANSIALRVWHKELMYLWRGDRLAEIEILMIYLLVDKLDVLISFI